MTTSRLLRVVALAAAVAVVPSAAWAMGPQPQSIIWAQVPDLVVGQFAEVEATASSGLPVEVTADGPCRVRAVDGPPVVVATGAGTCTLTAAQAGDDEYAPAPNVRQAFTFHPAETDLALVIPGPDVLAPGDALSAYVTAVGEEGDDPAPTGSVTLQFRNAAMTPVATESVDLDAAGHALVTIPGDRTATWPEGLYRIQAAYAGNAGFLPTVSDALAFAVDRDPCPPAEICTGEDRLQGRGGITMSLTPGQVFSGDAAAVTLSGFPYAGIPVRFTITDPRQQDPVKATVSSRDGAATLSLATGTPGTYGLMRIEAAYSFYEDDVVYRDTLVADYPVRARTVLELAPPNTGRTRFDPTAGIWPKIDPRRKVAVLPLRLRTNSTDVPRIIGHDRTGYPCLVTTVTADAAGPLATIATADACDVLIAVPATEWVTGAALRLQVTAWCQRRRPAGYYPPCVPGGEPIDIVPAPGAAPDPPTRGSTVTADEPPAANVDDAPRLVAPLGTALHLRVPWPAGDAAPAVAERRNGEWAVLGTAPVGPDGMAALPTLVFDRPGLHVLRLRGDTTGYVVVDVPVP